MKNRLKMKNPIVDEIINRLKKLNPAKVIIFGSYAKNEIHENSDIDIVVILNKRGLSKSYEKMLENKREVSQLILDLRKIVPIDLLVYTIDEWEYLKKTGSLFFKEIEEKGINLTGG